MNQPSLLTVATDDTVKKPSNLNQWQAVRDDAAAGSGRYFAYDKNGNKEEIGGPGSPIFSDQATATDDITTQSLVDVVATGMTLTPPAGTYLVWFSGSDDVDNGSPVYNSIYANNAKIDSSEQKNNGSNSNVSMPFNCVAKVTVNGTQTIEGRWRIEVVDQTATMHQRTLTILKVG